MREKNLKLKKVISEMSRTTTEAIYIFVGYTKLISHNQIIVCLIPYNHQNEKYFFSFLFFRDFTLHSHSLRKNARNKQEEKKYQKQSCYCALEFFVKIVI
ncbi:hypothetical protein ACKWTF_006198 [Chironomus riparius]